MVLLDSLNPIDIRKSFVSSAVRHLTLKVLVATIDALGHFETG